jgi:hypothetical protein
MDWSPTTPSERRSASWQPSSASTEALLVSTCEPAVLIRHLLGCDPRTYPRPSSFTAQVGRSDGSRRSSGQLTIRCGRGWWSKGSGCGLDREVGGDFLEFTLLFLPLCKCYECPRKLAYINLRSDQGPDFGRLSGLLPACGLVRSRRPLVRNELCSELKATECTTGLLRQAWIFGCNFTAVREKQLSWASQVESLILIHPNLQQSESPKLHYITSRLTVELVLQCFILLFTLLCVTKNLVDIFGQ